MDELRRILARIERDFESVHLPAIQKFMRLPSVSATGEGIGETIDHLLAELAKLGATNVRRVDVPPGEFGHPQVYAEMIERPERPIVLIYSMYDVQPADPAEWTIDGRPIDPFGGEIHRYEWAKGFRGRCLVGRGAINTKAPTEAVLNVLRAIRHECAELPVNLIFVIEGEEELGSIHMEGFIGRFEQELRRADLLYFPLFSERFDGVVTFFLGVRGILPLKIRIEGGDWGGPAERDVHSSSSGVMQNPIFKMAALLHSLKNDDTGEVLVPGVMDDPEIVGPDAEDDKLLGKLENMTDWERLKESYGVRSFLKVNGKELSGREYFVRELFQPGVSVNGVSGGYVGEGTKTIIPQNVTANLDIRLAPFQKVAKVQSLYEKHIFSRFPMAHLSFGRGYPPAKMAATDEYVRAMVRAMEKFGKQIVFLPLLGGSAPFSLFQAKLGLPFVIGGLGHGGRAHSANEYAVLEADGGKVGGIKDYELSLARFLYDIAGKRDGRPAVKREEVSR